MPGHTGAKVTLRLSSAAEQHQTLEHQSWRNAGENAKNMWKQRDACRSFAIIVGTLVRQREHMPSHSSIDTEKNQRSPCNSTPHVQGKTITSNKFIQ